MDFQDPIASVSNLYVPSRLEMHKADIERVCGIVEQVRVNPCE